MMAYVKPKLLANKFKKIFLLCMTVYCQIHPSVFHHLHTQSTLFLIPLAVTKP